MIRRYSLFLLLVLFSCATFAQENTADAHQEPILGYYHLGMDFDECWAANNKIKEATEIPDSTYGAQSQYLLSINGIAFNVDGIGIGSDIDDMEYGNYTKGTTPLYFTGKSYCLNGKLVSITVQNPYPDMNGNFCYMPADLSLQKDLPKNQCRFDVNDIEMHNHLVTQTDTLMAHLSKKYGTPTKQYQIVKLVPLRKGEIYHSYAAHWYSLCKEGAVLPRAEWQSGNMKIVMGITNSATIFISFFDDMQLSHQNLDRLFKPAEQVKPAAKW